MLHYRHKTRKTVYLTCVQGHGGLCKVTTANTPYPYVVDSRNIETFDPATEKHMKLPMPKPQNQGASYNRYGQWVTIGKWDSFKLENYIKDLRSKLHEFRNADALQVQVDYIAALQHRLENPIL